ncbi:uncharacterized protein [Halyomorpha halys]|uniref:uncharacterized protein n=1 Tax=Halyomorpha halys TaxID=286706 RepID=UPI0034D1F6E3
MGTWYCRQHGEVDFYITQLLTGHGCFRAYQYRFKLDRRMPWMSDSRGKPVFFTCISLLTREANCNVCGGRITPKNVVSYMLLSDQHWNAVKRFTTVVLKRLREEERARRRD